MKVIKMPNIKAIKCSVCGCEYEYERRDKVVLIPKYGTTPLEYKCLLRCPICGSNNEMCFDEEEEEGKQ